MVEMRGVMKSRFAFVLNQIWLCQYFGWGNWKSGREKGSKYYSYLNPYTIAVFSALRSSSTAKFMRKVPTTLFFACR